MTSAGRAGASTLGRVADDVGRSRVGQVVSALFADHGGQADRETGHVDTAEVNRRMAMTASDISQSLEGARLAGQPDAAAGALPGAFGRWIGRVQKNGEWDDRARDSTLERQGNFSYGATAAALGLSKEFAQWGAGAAQRLGNAKLAWNGLR